MYSQVILGTPGLVSYWRLNEVAGTTAADSFGLNPGTIGGGYTRGVAGIPDNLGETGAAFSASGGAGGISVPHAPSLIFTDSISLEFWYKPAAVTLQYYNRIFQKQVPFGTSPFDDYGVAVNGAGAAGGIYFNLNIGGAPKTLNGVRPLTVGQWHHVVCTYDGAAMRIYVNGQLDNIRSQTGNIANSALGLLLGSGGYSGTIDELSLYNVVLSGGQVKEHYNAGLSGFASGTVRVTQAGAEAFFQGAPTVRNTLTAAELFRAATNPLLRSTISTAEVFSIQAPRLRHTISTAEILLVGATKLRTTGVMLEVFRTNQGTGVKAHGTSTALVGSNSQQHTSDGLAGITPDVQHTCDLELIPSNGRELTFSSDTLKWLVGAVFQTVATELAATKIEIIVRIENISNGEVSLKILFPPLGLLTLTPGAITNIKHNLLNAIRLVDLVQTGYLETDVSEIETQSGLGEG